MNINDSVGIKLTVAGRAILRNQYEAMRAQYPSLPPYTEPSEDAEGYTEMQLHRIMNAFGEYMFMGNVDLPFGTEIRLKTVYSRPAEPARRQLQIEDQA